MPRHFQSISVTKAGRALFSLSIVISLFIANTENSQAALNTPLDGLSIDLSEQAQEAVNNGVLVTINCEFANVESWLFFNLTSNEKMHQFTLSRHTLSNRYIVKRDNLSTPHMFRSIREATNYISTQAVALLESYTTYDTHRKMRLSLNKFELPAPMRLQAFLLDRWDLDTGWLAWEFES